MPMLKLRFKGQIAAILAKEALSECRSRHAVSVLAMFALTFLASVSMAVAGTVMPAQLAAALLWVIVFFCAMSGLARVFVQEQETGTLLGLRLYARGISVFYGKLLFNMLLLLCLSCLVMPLFVVLFGISITEWPLFILIVILGDIGIAAVATLLAGMVIYTENNQAIFTVLSFPVLLSQFLSDINATAVLIAGGAPEMPEILFLIGYDAAAIAAGILLFEYLWEEGL